MRAVVTSASNTLLVVKKVAAALVTFRFKLENGVDNLLLEDGLGILLLEEA